MRIQTPRESRREIVGRISERLGIPARYEGAPGFAYTIGEITVERDGGIVSGNDALLESLKPMLVEQGWLEAGPVDEQAARAEDDLEADVPEASAERMDIVSPLRDWTVTERISLLRTLYGRQCLLNRMMQGETLYIEEPVVVEITDNPPTDAADFKARVQRAAEDGRVRGIAFEGGKLSFSTPYCAEEPTRWMTFQKLLDGILHSARYAKRISIRPQVTPENEKYYANSWLMRMGFGGSEHKELRHTLMRHLNGYAAFKSEADMQAHREKYAQLRRDFRDVSERTDWSGGIQENRMSGEGVESDGTDHAG